MLFEKGGDVVVVVVIVAQWAAFVERHSKSLLAKRTRGDHDDDHDDHG